jgi:hypothetical protein
MLQPAASCTFNGTTIASGGSTAAFQYSTAPAGSTCTSQTRICTNGVLSGTYAYSSCVAQTAATSATLTTNKSSYAPGEAMTVTWSVTGITMTSDWIASIPVGGTPYQYNGYVYASGAANGSKTLNAPTAAGTYQVAYMPNNSYTDIGRSAQFTVGSTQTASCSNGLNSATYPSCMCPSGQTQSGSSCVASSCSNGLDIHTYTSCTCPSGTAQSGTSCVANSATCSNGLNISVYPSCMCPSGQTQSGSSCVPSSTNSGATIDQSTLTQNIARPTISGTAAGSSIVLKVENSSTKALLMNIGLQTVNGRWSTSVPITANGTYTITVYNADGSAILTTGSYTLTTGSASAGDPLAQIASALAAIALILQSMQH